MPEWVKNVSSKPVPEPCVLSPREQATLFQLQRRKHLEAYDEKYKRLPLCSAANCREEHAHERETLDALEARVNAGEVLMFRGRELRFEPGQIFQVPDYASHAIAKLRPGILVALKWEDVRHLSVEPPYLHFQTRRENLAIIVSVGPDEDAQLKHGTVTIEMKDGLVRHGDSQAWETAPTAIGAEIKNIINAVH